MLPDVQNVLSAAELASFVCARTFDGVSDSAHPYVSCAGTSFCGRHRGRMHGDSISIPVKKISEMRGSTAANE